MCNMSYCVIGIKRIVSPVGTDKDLGKIKMSCLPKVVKKCFDGELRRNHFDQESEVKLRPTLNLK